MFNHSAIVYGMRWRNGPVPMQIVAGCILKLSECYAMKLLALFGKEKSSAKFTSSSSYGIAFEDYRTSKNQIFGMKLLA